jgi:hypothetical protein
LTDPPHAAQPEVAPSASNGLVFRFDKHPYLWTLLALLLYCYQAVAEWTIRYLNCVTVEDRACLLVLWPVVASLPARPLC